MYIGMMDRQEEAIEWEKKSDRSPLWKHSLLFHEGEKFELDVQVRSKCFGRLARRMITEAVRIEELKEGETMNKRYLCKIDESMM